MQLPPFPRATDLEEKPSFPNYKSAHAVGTFSHELPTMHFAFNPDIFFPVPTQSTNTPSLGGRGDPLAVPGGCGRAWGLDQPPTCGRFASLPVLQGAPGHHCGEDQSLDLPVAARLCFLQKAEGSEALPKVPLLFFSSFSTCCPCCSRHTRPWCAAASGSPCPCQPPAHCLSGGLKATKGRAGRNLSTALPRSPSGFTHTGRVCQLG